MRISSTLLAGLLASPSVEAFTSVVPRSRFGTNGASSNHLMAYVDNEDPSSSGPPPSPAVEASSAIPDESSTPDETVIEEPDIESSTESSATESHERRQALVKDVLRAASATDRGRVASSEQKERISSTVSELESMNPTPKPTESALIRGTWELIYSSTQPFRSSPFFMAGRAVCTTEEQARQYDWFCDMHRAALAISNVGVVRQIISEERMVSEFEVKAGAVPFLSDFTPFKYSGGLPLTIDGSIVSSADITPAEEGKAWEIFMDTVEIKGSNIPLLRDVLDAGLKLQSRELGGFLEQNVPTYSNPRPIFETTYLDESIRISRDQDGKIFVYGKASDSMEPSDYSGVDADLGLLGLLEGFNDAITKFYL